jgi:lipoprotein-releasing system permease protein
VYQTLLTSRYLTSRVIPLIAVAAVALCVALVIVVVSVMTGFLNMVQASGQTLMGDVIISNGISGIPHYERLANRLSENPQIHAATPIVDGWGLLRMPYPDAKSKQSETVQVWGIDPESFAKVTSFEDSLHWKNPTDNQRDWLLFDAISQNEDSIRPLMDATKWNAFVEIVNSASRSLNFGEVHLWEDVHTLLDDTQWNSLLAFDSRLSTPDALQTQGLSLSRNGKPGIILGLHVSDGNSRQRDGSYDVNRNDYWWMPRFEGTLTMLPVDAEGGTIEPESIIMPFVNEFQSGLFMIDESRIFVPIEVAQTLLHLDEATIVDLDDPTQIIGVDPARTTSILVRGTAGIHADELREIVAGIYDTFVSATPIDTLVYPPSRHEPGLTINTWEAQQASFTGPVEKERELMRTLFSIVYLVVAALILSIFWSIVFEKTRDIGILRSIGSSRASIVWIFLQYSAVIGIVGSLLGLLIGWVITKNINAIHAGMGNPPISIAVISFALAAGIGVYTIIKSRLGQMLPIVLGTLGCITLGGIGGLILFVREMGGLVVWDASVYYFSQIPNELDWGSSIFTVCGAILFCLLGALIPAAKAADTDPVKALRHE